MYGEGQSGDSSNLIYYLTVYNEPIHQPVEPDNVDVEGILRDVQAVRSTDRGLADTPARAQLLASGVGVPWALEAQQLLADDWGVAADVWSVTSWNELRRDGLAADAQEFLRPDEERRVPWVTQCLQDAEGPVVAVSDYMRAVQDQIREWVPGTYATLGADGFGFSDTRPAARRFFHIDGPSMAVRALQLLAAEGKVPADVPKQAAQRYRLDDVTAGTSGNAGGES